jgi:hypothetical protein
MTADQLRTVLRAVPFQSFIIRMADGCACPIPHPEFLFIMPHGRTVLAVDQNGSGHFLDVLLMTEIEMERTPAASP